MESHKHGITIGTLKIKCNNCGKEVFIKLDNAGNKSTLKLSADFVQPYLFHQCDDNTVGFCTSIGIRLDSNAKIMDEKVNNVSREICIECIGNKEDDISETTKINREETNKDEI